MKVLVAEDDAVTRLMLRVFLQENGFEVEDVDNGGDAWKVLCEPGAPRLAILDWVMPEIEGPDVCRMLRERENDDDTYTYVVLLTAKSDKRDIVAGIEAGADDYLTKPFDRDELHVRVRAGKRVIELQDRLIEVTHALENQATHDPLTGCLNRRAIFLALGIEIARAHREKRPLTIGMADLDHFKQVNDNYGHHAGDDVLHCFVDRIRAHLRPYDILGRYGGEEFLILTPGLPEARGIVPFERVREMVAAEAFNAAGAMLPVTCSIGVAQSTGDVDAATLLRAADAALYRAKAEGRNCIAVAAPEDYTPLNLKETVRQP